MSVDGGVEHQLLDLAPHRYSYKIHASGAPIIWITEGDEAAAVEVSYGPGAWIKVQRQQKGAVVATDGPAPRFPAHAPRAQIAGVPPRAALFGHKPLVLQWVLSTVGGWSRTSVGRPAVVGRASPMPVCPRCGGGVGDCPVRHPRARGGPRPPAARLLMRLRSSFA